MKGRAEWSLPPEVKKSICEEAGWFPEWDLFSTKANAQAPKAVTLFPEVGCATDAFSQDWCNIRAWAFPPFSLIPRFFAKMASARNARVLIVMPHSTVVPPVVRMIWSRLLPESLNLISSNGLDGRAACPTRLIVADVRSATT
jgi:hypothetical protein